MNNRLSLRSLALWALAGILLFAARSRADDPPARQQRMENRFLFVIDTSSAMKARAAGVEEAVMNLLTSGMKGELRKGDTIGVWTYSDHLNTDFPRQVWSEQKKNEITGEVRDYVRSLRYEKKSHLEKALPTIGQVIAGSERMTVILIFDGTDSIKGTPFDRDINDLHKHYAKEFRASHQPFVTLLAARDGEFFDYSINYPGTVTVPPTADPLPPPETNAPPPVVAVAPPLVQAPPQPTAPPRKIEINLTGADFVHKSPAPPPAATYVAPAVTPTPAPPPVVVTSAPPPAVTAPVVATQVTNAPVATSEPQSTPAPAPAAPTPAPIVTTPIKPIQTAPPRPAPDVPVAVAASTLQQAAMFIMAFSLLTIAVVLVLFLVRRSRGAPPASLISQSIDRSR